MRKGQFIFNFLRDYMNIGTISNPYPDCHYVLFNISDEYMTRIEYEYMFYKSDPKNYEFPKKPFGDSVISPEHTENIVKTFKEIMKNGS